MVLFEERFWFFQKERRCQPGEKRPVKGLLINGGRCFFFCRCRRKEERMALPSPFLQKGSNNKYVIALVDASFSTQVNRIDFSIGSFPNPGRRKVFDGLYEILLSEYSDASEFRLIWWNGTMGATLGNWSTGVYTNPTLLKSPTAIKMAWHKLPQAEITCHCVTEPWRAFEELLQQPEWTDPAKHPEISIAYLTDGELGFPNCSTNYLKDLKARLVNSISRVLDRHPGIVLDILTLEHKQRDLQRTESLVGAVGCDVWNALGPLLNRVRKFKSWNPSHSGTGFVQRSNVQLRPGEVPYGDEKFEQSRVAEFIHWLRSVEIPPHKKDADQLFEIILRLTTTVGTLFSGKPVSTREKFCRKLSSLFKGTAVDQSDTYDLLVAGVAQELQDADKSLLNTEKRSQLKATFAEAEKRLGKSVHLALGIALRERFTTFPVGGRIFSGSGVPSDGFQTLQLTPNSQQNEGAFYLDEIVTPILPAVVDDFSSMEKQCLRQWLRRLVGRERRVPETSDAALLWVLAYVLCVGINCPSLAQLWKDFGQIMLEKNSKHLASQTLYQALRKGTFPEIGDSPQGFAGLLETISHKMFSQPPPRPMTLWYAICATLDKDLACAQYIHCSEDVTSDIPDYSEDKYQNLINWLAGKLCKPFSITCTTIEERLDYNCPYSNKSTLETGGLRILPHDNGDDERCSCSSVVDVQEFARMRDRATPLLCPVCFETLDVSRFEEVAPARMHAAQANEYFDENSCNPFVANKFSVTSAINAAPPTVANTTGLTGKGVIVRMNGVVGCGKSTLACALKTEVERLGGVCVVQSTDEHFRKGGWNITDSNAWIIVRKAIATEFLKVEEEANKSNPLRVCILDTCGGDLDQSRLFDVPVGDDWRQINVWPNLIGETPELATRQDKSDYLAWSFWNVLSRDERPAPDMEQRLPPGQVPYAFCPRHGEGLPIALKVSQKKASALKLSNCKGGGSLPTFPKGTPIETALEKLQQPHDRYQAKLRPPEESVKILVKSFYQQ